MACSAKAERYRRRAVRLGNHLAKLADKGCYDYLYGNSPRALAQLAEAVQEAGSSCLRVGSRSAQTAIAIGARIVADHAKKTPQRVVCPHRQTSFYVPPKDTPRFKPRRKF